MVRQIYTQGENHEKKAVKTVDEIEETVAVGNLGAIFIFIIKFAYDVVLPQFK